MYRLHGRVDGWCARCSSVEMALPGRLAYKKRVSSCCGGLAAFEVSCAIDCQKSLDSIFYRHGFIDAQKYVDKPRSVKSHVSIAKSVSHSGMWPGMVSKKAGMMAQAIRLAVDDLRVKQSPWAFVVAVAGGQQAHLHPSSCIVASVVGLLVDVHS